MGPAEQEGCVIEGAGRAAGSAHHSAERAEATRLPGIIRSAGDAVLVLLIMIAGIIALSPFSAAAAARETLAARRRERALAAQFSPVWARQVRRNAALRLAPPFRP